MMLCGMGNQSPLQSALSTARPSSAPSCAGHAGHRLYHSEAIRRLVPEASHGCACHRRRRGWWHPFEDRVASHAGSHRTDGEPLTGNLLDVIHQRVALHTLSGKRQTRLQDAALIDARNFTEASAAGSGASVGNGLKSEGCATNCQVSDKGSCRRELLAGQ